MSRQGQQILEYIAKNGSITPIECFDRLRITKLSTRIGELVREGQPIGRELVKNEETGTRYMRYFLEKRCGGEA